MPNNAREAEAAMKRQNHDNFKDIEASRAPFDDNASYHTTRTPNPDWRLGNGANYIQAQASPSATMASHLAVNPFDPSRSMLDNYKLLIGAVTPRPIAFLSTRSADGMTENLAPFSFFNMVNVDPPMFVTAVISPIAGAKDSLRNLLETGECVINICSEGFVEAMNAASVDAPYGSSEWAISGLTPVYDCKTVKAARVKESVFSIEAKLESVRDFHSRTTPGTRSGSFQVLEGVYFWAREDALNEEKNMLDMNVSLWTLCLVVRVADGSVIGASAPQQIRGYFVRQDDPDFRVAASHF
jgi:flavin reductase (DIM6/NTAB) family NADH-FMN oxidoreductase RutF